MPRSTTGIAVVVHISTTVWGLILSPSQWKVAGRSLVQSAVASMHIPATVTILLLSFRL